LDQVSIDGRWQVATKVYGWIGLDVRDPALITEWKKWYSRVLNRLCIAIRKKIGNTEGSTLEHLELIILAEGTIRCKSINEIEEIRRGLPEQSRTPDVSIVEAAKIVCKEMKGAPELTFPGGTCINQIAIQSILYLGAELSLDAANFHVVPSDT
jgi:hypothetical protein